MKRIDKKWKEYQRQVIPNDAPPIQITECRKAFYAGASALMGVVMSSLSPGQETTDADVVVMEEIQQELTEFSHFEVFGEAKRA